MTDLIACMAQIRAYCSQILVLQFASWVTMIPFAIYAGNEVLKILKRIR